MDWVETALAENGLRRTGRFEPPHMRPWSLVLPAPTSGGRVYFKATAPSMHFEAALVRRLSTRFPEYLPELLAVEEDEGWFLSLDGGEVLRARRSTGTVGAWEAVLDAYAKIQTACAGDDDELLALGLPDRRPSALPANFREVLLEPRLLCLGDPRGLTGAELRALEEFAPRFDDLCARLARSSLPASLDHGDLHDGNIFFQAGRPAFFDWGDAALAHPFFSLTINIVDLEKPFVLDEGSPWFERLRDRYLGRWPTYASPDELQAAFRLARRIGPFVSVLRWRQALGSLPPGEPNPYPWGIASLLRELLRRNPGGQPASDPSASAASG